MKLQTITQRWFLGVICVSLLVNSATYAQSGSTTNWDLGLNVSPNFAYQQRSTPRNRAIQMRPFPGIDFGLSLSRTWNNNFIQFTPAVGVTRNKTRSSLHFEGFDVSYHFGSSQNRFHASLLYGRTIALDENTQLQANFGGNAGYAVFSNSYFQDLNYTDLETRLRNYFVCFSSGIGVKKHFVKTTFYWGLQINQGLLSYTRVEITLNQYQTTFLSKGSSINLVNIIYLNNKD